MKKICLQLLLLVCCLSALHAQVGSRGSREARAASSVARSEQRRDAVYSILVVDLQGDSVVYAHKPTVRRTPASVVKLLTTASAFQLLTSYPFITNYMIDGKVEEGVLKGDLWIEGSGDPSLYSKYFPSDSTRFRESLEASLAAQQIDSITGSVYISAHKYDKKGVQPTWAEEDHGDWYANGIYGFNIFDNWLEVQFKTGAPGRKVQMIGTYPPNATTRFQLQLRSVRKGAYVQGKGEPLVDFRVISGSLPCNRACYNVDIDLPNPPKYGAVFVTRMLQNSGIGIAKLGEGTFQSPPANCKLIGQYYSPSLADICKQCNVHSLNHYAEALIKAIALQVVGEEPATTQTGIDTCMRYWQQQQGIWLQRQPTWVDGSGLSRSNQLTAEELMAVLRKMATGDAERFAAFVASLPQAGKEGSVKRFLKEVPYQAYLKSGSMRGVQCYAGYVRYGNKQYAVVFLCNEVRNRTATRQTIQSVLDALLLE